MTTPRAPQARVALVDITGEPITSVSPLPVGGRVGLVDLAGEPIQDVNGLHIQGSVSNAKRGASETMQARVTNTNSTAVATIITPTPGTAVRILSVNINFKKATENGLEVYFGTGANIGTDSAKSITEANQAAIGPVYEKWDDWAGPVGEVDEVVSRRGNIQVNEDVNLIILYREEVP